MLFVIITSFLVPILVQCVKLVIGETSDPGDLLCTDAVFILAESRHPSNDVHSSQVSRITTKGVYGHDAGDQGCRCVHTCSNGLQMMISRTQPGYQFLICDFLPFLLSNGR